MHPAAVLQFERMISEYDSWRAGPETERSPAPGVVVGTRDRGCAPRRNSFRAEWRAELGLPDRATYASCRGHLHQGFHGRRRQCHGLMIFPSRTAIPDPAVRELHPQPSDDSAFQP